MKKVKNFLLLSLLVTAAVWGSCSKDNASKPTPSPTHKVVFKAIASPGSNLQTAVFGVDGSPKVQSISGSTWTSEELTGTGRANAEVNGIGADASSTLTVEVWVDGIKKKQETGLVGRVLSTQIEYVF